MSASEQKDLTTVATELIDAFNAGDWERFKATLSPNVVYEETGTGRRLQGVDAYLQLLEGWKQAIPDVKGTIHHAIAGSNIVAQEMVWEGTHSGPLMGPGGAIPASGKLVTVPASIWVTFQGDKVQEVHHHLDVMSLLQQIGAIPAP